MILGVVEVISIKYRVVLGELGEKRPQMPAWGKLWQLLLFQWLLCTNYYSAISQAGGHYCLHYSELLISLATTHLPFVINGKCTGSLNMLIGWVVELGILHAEEVRQGLNYALRHALACTINCVLLAITHAYKCSWQLKPRVSCYFAAQKAYFLKAKLMDLKIGLNGKSISVSHSPEIRLMPSMMVESIDCWFIAVISWNTSRKSNAQTHRSFLPSKIARYTYRSCD